MFGISMSIIKMFIIFEVVRLALSGFVFLTQRRAARSDVMKQAVGTSYLIRIFTALIYFLLDCGAYLLITWLAAQFGISATAVGCAVVVMIIMFITTGF